MAEEGERLGKCEVCNIIGAKYTCPKCEVKSCSLECVNIHKKEFSCDGIRDRTLYKPLSKFTNLDLQNDYKLLEEISRSANSYSRDPLKYYTRHDKNLPVHLHRLGVATSNRGIRILFLPQHFSRHKSNSTYLNWKTREIFWKVEWVFLQAQNLKCSDDRVAECECLSAAANNYLNPDVCDSSLRDRLKFYHSAGLGGVVFLLKAERVQKSGSRFFELDPTLPLKDNLKGKTIIEFPTIFVILKEHKDVFEVIESDEEEIHNEDRYVPGQVAYHYRNPDKNSHQDKTSFFFGEACLSDEEEKHSRNTKRPRLDIPCSQELIHQKH